ncbi:33991_t:CDS:1 [Gigaspora margarita]|uniref:33991_t:CDS:1 n=1 Tax=Gigaspora margarita TaxID=4874 RepID=A0ABN7UFR3_GIGMA|nr:33991_t:CDS:1 [Gigaspora margarita]
MEVPVYQLPNAPPITEQHIAVKTLIRHFRNVSNIKLNFKNVLFEEKIELVKKFKVEFRSIFMETIGHSDNLAEFGEDLIEFVNGDGSNEDQLDLLNSLLIDARINKAAIENTNLKIKSLLNEMSKLTENLREDLKDFNEKKNVDASTYNDKMKAEELEQLYEIGANILSLLVGFGAAALVPNANTAVAATTKEVLLNYAKKTIVTMVTSKATKIVASLPAQNKRQEVIRLENILSERQKQILEKSKELKETIDLMDSCLKQLEVYWGKNVLKLQRVIEKYKSPSEHGSLRKELINPKRWQKTIEECRTYSHDINKEINIDIYVNQINLF